jgi:hypothetical protein
MTNEQRNLLRKLLKENVKENQKRIANNLVKIFVESKSPIKDQRKKIKKKQGGTPKSKFSPKVQKVSNPKLKRYGSVINVGLKNHSKFKKTKKTKLIENKDVEKYSNINNTEDTLPDNKKLDKLNINDDTYENDNDDSDNDNFLMNFTSLAKFTLSRDDDENNCDDNQIETNLVSEKDDKESIKNKSIVFQRKSFRDFVENNLRKDYEECLKFINST